MFVDICVGQMQRPSPECREVVDTSDSFQIPDNFCMSVNTRAWSLCAKTKCLIKKMNRTLFVQNVMQIIFELLTIF